MHNQQHPKRNPDQCCSVSSPQNTLTSVSVARLFIQAKEGAVRQETEVPSVSSVRCTTIVGLKNK